MRNPYITQQQKELLEIERMRELLSDGIAERKAIHHLNNEQIGRGLEIGERTIAKIINGGDVKLTLTQTMRLLRFAGLRLEGNHEL